MNENAQSSIRISKHISRNAIIQFDFRAYAYNFMNFRLQYVCLE